MSPSYQIRNVPMTVPSPPNVWGERVRVRGARRDVLFPSQSHFLGKNRDFWFNITSPPPKMPYNKRSHCGEATNTGLILYCLHGWSASGL